MVEGSFHGRMIAVKSFCSSETRYVSGLNAKTMFDIGLKRVLRCTSEYWEITCSNLGWNIHLLSSGY